MKKLSCLILAIATVMAVKAQDNLISNVSNRKAMSLDGKWQYIVDPNETGFYDYRYNELNEDNADAYWNSDVPATKTDKKEHGYIDKYSLEVPGDWNHQKLEFLYYEGTIWYKKTFDYAKKSLTDRFFIWFGAVNYRADVYLNGKKLGTHEGGFTPFNFEIPGDLIRSRGNFLVVKVDNKRHADDVPTLNTDWWNYGGITRDVKILELPQNFIQDFMIQLKKTDPGKAPGKIPEVRGWIKLNKIPDAGVQLTVEIPELKIKKRFTVTGAKTCIQLKLPNARLWSPEDPKRYRVVISSPSDRTEDEIGFRTIEAYGRKVLLNGKPIFLRGISIHGEVAEDERRAFGDQDSRELLEKARALNCNMIRLAHYPHDESMVRTADSLGILVWSEIPVYWTIDFANPAVLIKAKSQLHEMITRDHNRASIIIWSVGNETPVSQTRTDFMHNLIVEAKNLDSTRMVSAALEVNYAALKNENIVDDPLGKYVDLVAFNEYLGWYGGLPDQCRKTSWQTIYDKPFFISETGAGAKADFHADSLTRFDEEFQEWYYKEQVAMLKRMPDNFVGLSPWVLQDFRSPKRNNPLYQEGWNRKGLYGDKGNKKKAFYVLLKYYQEMKLKSQQP